MKMKTKFFWKNEVMQEPKPSKYWLEQVKERYNVESDAKLGEMLKLSRSAISQLSSGKTHIGIKTAITIGGLLDVDPLLIVSSVMALVEGESQEFWMATFAERVAKQGK